MNKKRIRRVAAFGVAAVLIFAALVSCSHTARIEDAQGNRMELEISEMEKISLRGTDQWIFSAGASRENPVLLWLDGGPGGSEVGWVREYLGPLHQDVTIVCWDQRGTAKSYRAGRDTEDLLLEEYVEDVIALTELLIERYDTEQIYLLGHSWGSVIGVMAASRRPELYAAYIGTGQHINSIENDGIGWDMVHAGAIREQDDDVAAMLEAYGKPPFLTKAEDGTLVPDGEAYYQLLSRLYKYSPHAPADSGFDSMKMFFAPEHTLRDRINLVRGLIRGVKEVYPQLAYVDLEQDYLQLECPVFIINGRYDYTCVATITERWFEKLQAPQKDLLWLERSGHNGIFTEPEKVITYLTEVVLPAGSGS